MKGSDGRYSELTKKDGRELRLTSMEMTRQALIRAIHDRLGLRKLVWVGTRGHDGSSLMELRQFSESYALIAPIGSVSLDADCTLEQISGQRVDLDTYKFDEDRSAAAHEFRKRLLASLTEPAVVVAYRPLALLSTLCYPRAEFVTYLGMFHERQATFEHKPWVENELRRCGLPTIPWRYFAEEDRQRLEEEVAAGGVVVVRSNRSDGGAGLRAISSPEEIGDQILTSSDGFVAASPLLEPHLPLNVNACVFRDGTISLHPASIQLIGIRGCTRRQFGYCGNDFGAIKGIERKLLDQVESLARGAGLWLWSQGYVGAFGVDAIVHDGTVLLAEINPRFQGSSLLSAHLDKRMDSADIYLCHLAAHLELQSPPDRRLPKIVQEQAEMAQVVIHNCEPGETNLLLPDFYDCYSLELVPEPGIGILPDAIAMRALIHRSITNDGRQVDQGVLASLLGLLGSHNTLTQLPIKSEV